jgi:hypothetical protein
MDDFTLAVGTEKKPGGRFVAMFQDTADDEERIGFDAETIKIDVPEEWAKEIGEKFLSSCRGVFFLGYQRHLLNPVALHH